MKSLDTATPMVRTNMGKNKILIVEDDYIVALDLAMQLRSRGFEVEIASTGERALVLVNRPGSFHLILMDVDLGDGLDGIETADLLKHLDIPVIFLTCQNQIDLVNSGRISNDAYYLSKIEGFETILSKISTILVTEKVQLT